MRRNQRELEAAIRAYGRELDALRKRGLVLQARDLIRIRAAFREFVRRLSSSVPTSRFSQMIIGSILRDLAQEIDRLTQELDVTVRRGLLAQEQLANESLQAFMRHFTETGQAIGLVSLSPSQLDLVRDFSARLISVREGGLGARMLAAVDRLIRLSALGAGEGGFVIAERILQAMRGLRRFHWEAERIYRTEVLRIHSIVTQQGIERLAQRMDVQKMWRWSGISREEHARIDGQVVPADGKFSVPLPKGGTVKMMFPRDPVAPPEATINCGCYVVPVPTQALAAARELGIELAAFPRAA